MAIKKTSHELSQEDFARQVKECLEKLTESYFAGRPDAHSMRINPRDIQLWLRNNQDVHFNPVELLVALASIVSADLNITVSFDDSGSFYLQREKVEKP